VPQPSVRSLIQNFVAFVVMLCRIPLSMCTKSSLGSLVLACLPLDPRFAGSNPAEDDGIFKGDKNA
jgi:hypothetical protein